MGTAPAGSTVMVSDGSASALGTATASSTGAWSFTTAALAGGSYAFTATDTTSAGTSAASSPLAVTVTIYSPPPNPTLNSIVESPASGDLNLGKTVTLTLKLNEPVAVAGGTPTLTLNDGGTATYVGGSGSSALTFSYTVAGGQNTSDLQVTAVNLNSATVKDSAGNVADLSTAGLVQTGPQIDTTAPTISSLVDYTSTGTLDVHATVTLTVKMSEAATVTGGTPTLTLNDGGTAIYAGGSGTNTLTFTYTVGAGQNTSDLAVTAVNLNSATVNDNAGNAANLSLIGLAQSGPQIDTTTYDATADYQLILSQWWQGRHGYTNAHVLTLKGTAVANSTVEIFDGSAQLGTTTADSNGAWSYTTKTLSDGTHDFTAKDVSSSGR